MQVPSSNLNRFLFTYQTPVIASLADGDATTNSILFDADSTFQWVKLTAYADIAGAVQTSGTAVIPLVSLQILNTGSGRYYSNAPIPIAAYCGNWGLPGILSAPQFIAPMSSLQFNWLNMSDATTYANLSVQLVGFKIMLS